ncbi:MAG: hypothetical protein HYY68_00040 [Thaumarchaeota archaeon]|nr:hypothetical protein [Nitrososphaerota archaeon]
MLGGTFKGERKATGLGITLIVIGTVLFLIVASTGAAVLAIPTIILWFVGWGLPFAVVARSKPTPVNGTIIGLLILFGIGEFYLFPEHEVHIASGLGFGLPHTPFEGGPISHVIIGFIILLITMILTSVLALRGTKTN